MSIRLCNLNYSLITLHSLIILGGNYRGRRDSGEGRDWPLTALNAAPTEVTYED